MIKTKKGKKSKAMVLDQQNEQIVVADDETESNDTIFRIRNIVFESNQDESVYNGLVDKITDDVMITFK
ncbi:hypothetical protein [Desulfobacter vibrioformis]|uniref:hypothetical protein n=1 Tax=Desulfobacter vibrioformis TaxID=34031 RepID=UPI00055162B8|nr:hypothetical protein [Desulfobacter vibrioformis]